MRPEWGFLPAAIALAKRGRRFQEVLIKKRSFSASRHDQKSYERARRHHGNPLLPTALELPQAVKQNEERMDQLGEIREGVMRVAAWRRGSRLCLIVK